jgi:hypothetical protein
MFMVLGCVSALAALGACYLYVLNARHIATTAAAAGGGT